MAEAEKTKKLESLSPDPRETPGPLARRRQEMQDAEDAIESQRKGKKPKEESEMEYARRMRKKNDEE